MKFFLLVFILSIPFWHIIPFIQADRSTIWIAWQCLTLVASRILIVWLYNNTGKSLFAAALCHAMINVSWQMFPNQGSNYNPCITGLITMAAPLIVTVFWGPRTLIRNRNAHPSRYQTLEEWGPDNHCGLGQL